MDFLYKKNKWICAFYFSLNGFFFQISQIKKEKIHLLIKNEVF